MRRLKVLLAAPLLAAGLSVVSASPAHAALPTCTSWNTYYAAFTTDYVVHVPSSTYWTGTVDCTLRQGNRNDAVKVLQRALHYCHGYRDLAIDGDYGPHTRAVVLERQQIANGSYGANIAEDGIYGPQTRDWIQFTVWTWPANQRTIWCEHSPI